jgi:hypothetical protein
MLFLFCNQINNDVFVLVDIYTMQLICALLVFLFLAVANVTRVILRPLSALSLIIRVRAKQVFVDNVQWSDQIPIVYIAHISLTLII